MPRIQVFDTLSVTESNTCHWVSRFVIINIFQLFSQQKKLKKMLNMHRSTCLIEFEDTGNDTKVRKPVPYTPTAYADVVPTKVINEADPNTNLPPCENLKKTIKCK